MTKKTDPAPRVSPARLSEISSRPGSRRLARRPAWRWFSLAAAIFLAGQLVLLSDPAGRPLSPAQAAIATQPAPVKDNLSIALPGNKAEAREFERLHRSLYDFDEVGRLRQLRGSGGSPDRTGYNAVAEGTPRPTQTGNFLPWTPNPTNGSADRAAYAFTPAAGCGPVVADIYENDDTPANAKEIIPGSFPNAPRQTHTLTSVSSASSPVPPDNGDEDWVTFTIPDANLGLFYLIEARNFAPATVDTVLELYKSEGPYNPVTNPTITRLNANDNIGAPDRIIYDPATGDDDDTFFIRVYGAPNRSCTGSYELSVNTATSSSVLTPTAVPTNTATGVPVSATPDPCHDPFEDDSSPLRAKELRVSFSNTPPFGGAPGAPDAGTPNSNIQQHFICPVGDQDWVYVDLVKGKPYSIFTTSLSNGLDTMLALFERNPAGNLNALYSSDDFPGMGLASRIDFVVPATPDTATGEFVRYYVVVKDVAGKGVPNLSYNLVLSSPGNGKNDCIDYYEPDGLQHLAKEILINETQTRVSCPDGDADWVKFFAKAGRTYSLRTAFSPIPGVDTVLNVFAVAFDPNDPAKVVSQRLLGSNDDVSPAELNSRVDFAVPSDGIYYAQIKNNGDIGRAGFFYQLTYSVAGTSVAPPPTVAPATPTPNSAATATSAAQTATARANATATAGSSSLSVTGPAPLALTFADPAFQRLWYYSDLAVAQNQAQRSWEWGPRPGTILREPYAESPGGERQVQYFDKSRMEINNPKGDRNQPWFVSNGLLVREMITGQVAAGDRLFQPRSPATLPLAGDTSAANRSPTYASLAGLITQGDRQRAADATGQVVRQGLAADGTAQTLATPPEQVRLAAFVTETGHNIPQVFYDYMLSSGKVYDNGFTQGALRDWVFAMGYPLSEPYWVKARVGGVEKDVLVQVFERRVLTYTPANSPEWRVEMANVGQHYYLWRYGKNLDE